MALERDERDREERSISTMGPRHGRLRAGVLGFAKGLFFTAIGCGSLPFILLLLTSTSWGRLWDSQREEVLHDYARHYRPLVDALHQYEDEWGESPRTLEDLVPEYLEQLPRLELKYGGELSYFPTFSPSEHPLGSTSNRMVLYATEVTEPQAVHEYPIERLCAELHTHVLVISDYEGKILYMRGYRRGWSSRRRVSGPWIGPDEYLARSSQVGALIDELQPAGKVVHLLKRRLARELHEEDPRLAWDLVIWLPENWFDLDADSFYYHSNRQVPIKRKHYDGWTFSGWK